MSGTAEGRRCETTGLYLLPATGSLAYRVAKDRGMAALTGHLNTQVGPLPPGSGPDPRGRFDTVGSTVYFAQSPECAFGEVLRGFRQELLQLAPLARRVGFDDLEAYVAAIITDATSNDVDQPWAVSWDWQWDRSLYHVRMPRDGWWVQIDHHDTLNALASQLAHVTFGQDLGRNVDLTSADLEGEDRNLTTYIAEHIRGLTLDTGDQPLGISYRSKSLYGRCYGWWDRRTDAGLPPGRNDPRLAGSTNIDTPAFRRVAADYELPVLPSRTGH